MGISQHPFPLPAPRPGLRWLANTASRFIDSNRQVIMPGRDSAAKPVPFSASWRLAYLAVSWVITASFLHQYSNLIVPLIPASSYGREFLICGGQIFWQMGFLALLHTGKTWDYLGNMMTISLGGGLLLALIQFLVPSDNSPYLFGALFTGVAGLMFFEHIRRTRILGVSRWLTVTWVLYRVVLLGVILWL